MANPTLEKIIKLTTSQYNTLSEGGTIGNFTGLNDKYLYLIQEDDLTPNRILITNDNGEMIGSNIIVSSDGHVTQPNSNTSITNFGSTHLKNGLNIEGNTVINGNVTLPNNETPLTVFGEAHLKNNTFITGNTILTGEKGVSDSFIASNYHYIELAAHNELKLVGNRVIAPTAELLEASLANYNSDISTPELDIINKQSLYNYNTSVNAKIRSLKYELEPIIDKALDTANNVSGDINNIYQTLISRYNQHNQADIQRLYNDERPTDPQKGQIYCLIITDSRFGEVGTQTYYQYDGKNWIELHSKYLPLSGGSIDGSLAIGASTPYTGSTHLVLTNQYHSSSIKWLPSPGGHHGMYSLMPTLNDEFHQEYNIYLPPQSGTLATTNDLEGLLRGSFDSATGVLTISTEPITATAATVKVNINGDIY